MTRHRTRWAALLVVATLPLALSACRGNPTTARPTSDQTSRATDVTHSGTVQQPWTLLADEPEDVLLAAGPYALTANGSARGWPWSGCQRATWTTEGGPSSAASRSTPSVT